MTTTKIAITDDHVMVLKGIVSLFEKTPEIIIIGEYENGEETLKGLALKLPDVLLLDINLPDINGIDLSKQLLKLYPDLKIIALTNFEEITFVKKMLKNGVHGYLLKNTDKLELIEAIKTVLSGDVYLQKDIQKKLFSQTTKKATAHGLIPKITRREHEVLVAISEELTTREISDKLFISPKTVETHRMNLMSKLGAKNSVGIIKIAIENQLL